jgi:hypothetical protein
MIYALFAAAIVQQTAEMDQCGTFLAAVAVCVVVKQSVWW